MLSEEIEVLHQLINLHPLNAYFWNSLIKAYENLKHSYSNSDSNKEFVSPNKVHKHSASDLTSNSVETKEQDCDNVVERTVEEGLASVTLKETESKRSQLKPVHDLLTEYPLDLVLLTCSVRTR